MKITLDIAAAASSFFWPLIVLIIFIVYRSKIPYLAGDLFSRIKKLEFGGISIELAKAKAFEPEWNETTGGLDLRRKAVALEINDSYTGTFRSQLLEEGIWDYALIDLGDGNEWLTSRLYIMAIVFARMKGIKCLVFVKSSGNIQRRFVGWAEPDKVRWALAKRFPWLEEAYSASYSALINFQNDPAQNAAGNLPLQNGGIVVSNEGRIGSVNDREDPWPSISLIQQFVGRLQSTPVIHFPEDQSNWVQIDSATQPFEEHARWVSSLELEDMLGIDLRKTQLDSEKLSMNRTRDNLNKILSASGQFIAVTNAEQQFEQLIDRNVILEQVAKKISSVNAV